MNLISDHKKIQIEGGKKCTYYVRDEQLKHIGEKEIRDMWETEVTRRVQKRSFRRRGGLKRRKKVEQGLHRSLKRAAEGEGKGAQCEKDERRKVRKVSSSYHTLKSYERGKDSRRKERNPTRDRRVQRRKGRGQEEQR